MSLIPNKALKEGKKCWTDFMSVLRGEMENAEMKQRKVDAHVQGIPSRMGWEMRKQRRVAAGLRRFYSFGKYLIMCHCARPCTGCRGTRMLETWFLTSPHPMRSRDQTGV